MDLVQLLLLALFWSRQLLPVYGALSEAQKQEVLTKHNNYRAQTARGETTDDPNEPSATHYPTASNMNALLWDPALAAGAQRFTDECNYAFNSNRKTWLANDIDNAGLLTFDYDETDNFYYYIGENVGYAWSNTGTNIIDSWFDQHVNGYGADFETGYSNTGGGQWYSFTQMVWASTRYVGCGATDCGGFYFFVCDYWPGGNFGYTGQRKLYSEGTECSACDADRTDVCVTTAGLCDGCVDSGFNVQGTTTPDYCCDGLDCESLTTTTAPVETVETVPPGGSPYGEISQALKVESLTKHNNYRSQTAIGNTADDGTVAGGDGFWPKASDMNSLLWDDGLAAVAQQWSAQCNWGHNDAADRKTWLANDYSGLLTFEYDDTSIGENMAVSLSNDGTDGIDRWFDEHTFWHDVEMTQAAFGSGIGHFSQMVWADTRYVGCGATWCPNGATNLGWSSAYIYVCNYWPSGNYLSSYIYTEGTECTACDADRTDVCGTTAGLCGGCVDSKFDSQGTTTVDYCCDGLGNCLDRCSTTGASC